MSGFGYLVGGLERIELGLGYGNILLHLGSLDRIRDRLGLSSRSWICLSSAASWAALLEELNEEYRVACEEPEIALTMTNSEEEPRPVSNPSW